MGFCTDERCRGARWRRRKQRNERGKSKRLSEPTSVPVKVEVSESKEGGGRVQNEITEGRRNHPLNMTDSPYRSGVVRLMEARTPQDHRIGFELHAGLLVP